MPGCSDEEVLAAHNEVRKRHGAPPLKWSNECMVYAQKCADENAAMGRLKHCYFTAESTGRKMGQNISVSKVLSDAEVVQEWYQQVKNPGYDFDAPGYQVGTAEFTAMVWYDTTHVGMARSKDGDVIVANYFPPGNWSEKENFRVNVLPVKAAFEWRPRNDFERNLSDHFHRIARDIGNEPMVVPTPELVERLQQLGEEKLADAIANNDLDRNGFTDIREFCTAVCSLRHSDDSAQMRKDEEESLSRVLGFVGIDDSGDGKLSGEEFVRYVTTLAPIKVSRERAMELLDIFDKDKDGCLDYEEFIIMQDSGALDGPNFSIEAKAWEEVEQRLKDVPLLSIVEKIRKHLQRGGGSTAKVTRTETSIVAKLVFAKGKRKPEVLEGVWGDRAAKRDGKKGSAKSGPRAGLGSSQSQRHRADAACGGVNGRRAAKELSS